ncbi:MAG: bifunctional homocysteine S-methyltransferase/methylenetetrahydrofolate reductase, partial [Deltaproteobacteria bacterium]|nr:bifunctional homocysteine S-methyltransferase/methylenetetrahydrofolate reductase [Deltaproteobacteria bacterium]
ADAASTRDRPRFVAGSMGPGTRTISVTANITFDDVRAAFAEQAKILAGAGCDLLIIETIAHPMELRMAVQAARSVTSLPIVAQVAITDEGKIVDDTDPVDLAREMVEWGANVVGANCNGPEVIHDVVVRMVTTGLKVSAMPNAGQPRRIEDRLIYLATPEHFGVFARRMYKAGVKLVGGCCGTSPAHVTRLAAAARMVWPRQGPRVSAVPPDAARQPPKPLAERSRLGALLGHKFVVSVEVNPAAGLGTEEQVAAARMLLQAGADVINSSDGPRATARMGNLALAVRLESELGAEVLLHVCCRDRNLLALQAHLLGAHTLGIRNLVIITGDPPKVGDYPDATAVYDLDSVGLLKMAHGFNQGVDPSGKALGGQTAFVLATGVEPAATDFEREMARLRQKIAAGADLVMTQPIYDAAQLERFLADTRDLTVPVLVGVLPLASYRNAEFIHNHVPGMSIPEAIRERMRKAGKGEAARREGVAIAVESLMGVRDRVAGAYIMPPLGRYEMAAQILEALGKDRALGVKAGRQAR